ncbi:glycoprotein A33 (transmembrane), paralog a [Amia ocellicauda]|uniref:glycoprotein A33 (transmembrane), paralog a n=1 Tax=Amia ocellicauda TaxID=2972642 RepID=UPI003463B264
MVGFLIFTVLSAASALVVKIPQVTYEAARGDNVTIPCTFTSSVQNRKALIVQWTRLSNDPIIPGVSVIDYYWPATSVDVAETYDGRAGLVGDPNTGDASIYINRLTVADNGVYACTVSIPSDKTGTPQATTKLVVLVAPSRPICKIVGTAEYGQNISLTCVSEEGSPAPTYKWTSYDVKNLPRANPPKSTDQNGVLSLVNVSIDTSGYFICNSQNKIRSASCNITLTVLPPSMNIATTAVIIAVAAVAVVIIGIIAYCCCCRKKGEPQEYPMVPPPEGMEYSDANPEKHQPQNGRPYHDDHWDEESERRGTPVVPPNKPRRIDYED